MLLIQGVGVWFLFRELRSHMPCSMAKQKKEPTESLLSIFYMHTVFQAWRHQPHGVFIPEVTDYSRTFAWISTLAHKLLPVLGPTLLPETNRHTNKNQEIHENCLQTSVITQHRIVRVQRSKDTGWMRRAPASLWESVSRMQLDRSLNQNDR